MTVTKVVTVVKTKKGPHTHKKKGELMENDQDAMEVRFFLTLSIWFMRKLRFVQESWILFYFSKSNSLASTFCQI